MSLIFGRQFIVRHREDITSHGSSDTVHSSPTVEVESPWGKGGVSMYRVDLYARDRVMKSARLLLPYLSQVDAKPDTILDVGCFTWEARKYYPRAINYIGLDQKKFHAKTQVVDLNHGFEPIPCNHALCLETLEHLIDPEDTLQSLYNSLHDEGKLVVSLPNEATLFHRIRALFGTVDGECFASEGKHLHLPSLKQSRLFLSGKFEIVKEVYYISPTACGSRQAPFGKILRIFPDFFHQWLADMRPSLFARGFIFLLKKRKSNELHQTS